MGLHGRKTRGFTLIELAIVIAIMSFLLAMVSKSLSGFRNQNILGSSRLKVYSDLNLCRSKALQTEQAIYFEVRDSNIYRVYEGNAAYTNYKDVTALSDPPPTGVTQVNLGSTYNGVSFTDKSSGSNILITFGNGGELSTAVNDQSGLTSTTDTNGFAYYPVRLKYGTGLYQTALRVYLNGRTDFQ